MIIGIKHYKGIFMITLLFILIALVSFSIVVSDFSVFFFGLIEIKEEKMSEKEESNYDTLVFINGHYTIK